MGNATSGQAWATLGSAVWGINGNQAYLVSPTSANEYAAIDGGVYNGTVQATIAAYDGSFTQSLLFRCSDSSNLWTFSLNGTGTLLFLFKCVAGTYVQVGSSVSLTCANGDVWKVVLSGNNISLYQNNVLIISATDSFNATATKSGLRSQQSAGRFSAFSTVVPSVTLSGPSAAIIGSPATITLTPTVAFCNSCVETVTDDQSNTLGSVTFSTNSATPQTITFTPSSSQAGTRTLTATGSPAAGTTPTLSLSVCVTARAITQSFGLSYAGLSTVGYTIYDDSLNVVGSRSTAGVSEYPVGSGNYAAVAGFNYAIYHIVFDTGGSSPIYGSWNDLIVSPGLSTIMPPSGSSSETYIARKSFADWGATGLQSTTNGGSGTLYCTVIDYNGNILVARTNAGIYAVGGTSYGFVVGWNYDCAVMWDDGTTYYTDYLPALNPPALDGISTTDPTGSSSAWNFRQMLVWLFRRFGKTSQSKAMGAIKVFGADGSTVLSSQTAVSPYLADETVSGLS